MSEKLYYIQDRGFCGNCMLWWEKDDCGYTTDIARAAVFTKDETDRMELGATKRVWPKEYIDARVSKHVDLQHCNHDEAMKGKV